MLIETWGFIDWFRAVLEGMLYAAVCAALLFVSWSVIVHQDRRPRPMWEPRKGQDH